MTIFLLFVTLILINPALYAEEKKANDFAKGLIQKNIDNFYHRAWVIKEGLVINDVCEECKKEEESVKQNLIMHGYKICKSCNLAKTIFPI